MGRDYTGYDKTADGKRAGFERLIDLLEAEFGLWNNGTLSVRPKRGKSSMSVHATGRAGDLSWRGAPYRGTGNYADAERMMDFLAENADALGIEAIFDYYPAPYGRGWKCDRADWMVYSKRAFSGAPGGDWVHIEISNDLADDADAMEAAFVAALGRTPEVKPRPAKPTSKAPSGKTPWLQRGSKGKQVKEVQEALGITIDGDFGPKTEAAVRKFQAENDLHVDGIVGPATYKVITASAPESAPEPAPAPAEAPKSGQREYPGRPVRRGSRGDDVKWIQQIIGTTVDGIFGNVTHRTLQQWQRRHRLASDGVAGPKTWRALNASL